MLCIMLSLLLFLQTAKNSVFSLHKCYEKKIPIKSAKIITEDLGKIFEKSICLLYEIEYDGNYKYCLDKANKLKTRITNLKSIFPYNLKHIAKNGNPYDFSNIENTINLSAKTTKKNGMISPQIIGQPSKKKFCEFFKLNNEENNEEQIKIYIENNVYEMLNSYISKTFDCSVIYYNEKLDKLLFIKLKSPIIWNKYTIEFSHLVKNKKWNESTSIKINNIKIGEFQIHNHRDCIKFRWSIENLIKRMTDNFDILYLEQCASE